jgi:hypothetical protein
MSLAAFVRQASRATLGQKTADLTISGNIRAAGHSVIISGTGQSDLTTHALNIAMHIEGHRIALDELSVLGHLYLSINVPGQTMKQATGHEWYELPISIRGVPGSGDPVQALALATHEGSKVVSLGSKVIDGITTVGYAVTPTRAAMLAQLRNKTVTIPASEQATVRHEIETTTPPTYEMWFDRTHDLMRRLSMQMSLPIASAGAGSGGDITFDFTHYGVPVNVKAPSASEVTTKAP